MRSILLLGALWLALPSCAGEASPEVRPATAEQILSVAREPGPKVVLVNVWATWCAPCRAEFPDLMRLHRDYRDRGLRLVLVSADFEDQLPEVKRFLASRGVDFASYIKTEDDMRFINALNSKWTGALPATFVYDAQGRMRYFRQGMGTYELFEREVLNVLSPTGRGSTEEERS